jgi:hypothetical protein
MKNFIYKNKYWIILAIGIIFPVIVVFLFKAENQSNMESVDNKIVFSSAEQEKYSLLKKTIQSDERKYRFSKEGTIGLVKNEEVKEEQTEKNKLKDKNLNSNSSEINTASDSNNNTTNMKNDKTNKPSLNPNLINRGNGTNIAAMNNFKGKNNIKNTADIGRNNSSFSKKNKNKNLDFKKKGAGQSADLEENRDTDEEDKPNIESLEGKDITPPSSKTENTELSDTSGFGVNSISSNSPNSTNDENLSKECKAAKKQSDPKIENYRNQIDNLISYFDERYPCNIQYCREIKTYNDRITQVINICNSINGEIDKLRNACQNDNITIGDKANCSEYGQYKITCNFSIWKSWWWKKSYWGKWCEGYI